MKEDVRYMTAAGQFYEKNPAVLKDFIDSAITEANINILPENSLIRGLIAPHAGYVFSGKTAIKTISTAAGNKYDNIFIIAPSHYVGFRGVSLSSFDKYDTPFGCIEVNSKITEQLVNKNFIRNNEPHIHEHSLEVQLPIIKHFFPETPIVPMVCGQINYETAIQIAKFLEQYWNKKNLWIISSDFTHYGRNFGYLPFKKDIRENIKNLDFGAIEKILDLNHESLYNYLNSTEATICGKFPILILTLLAANSSDRNQIKTKLVEYTTSGELTGDYSHTVSYAGIVFYSKN